MNQFGHEESDGRGPMWLLLSFDGRIPRREFWRGFIGYLVIGFSLVHLITQFGKDSVIRSGATTMIFFALMLWIYLAIVVKRYHDIDKSGWWYFVWLIPLIGPLWQLAETGFLRGTIGDNTYGPDPTFKDDKPDGLITTWYANGQKQAEGTYKDGKLVGKETEWDENGELVSE